MQLQKSFSCSDSLPVSSCLCVCLCDSTSAAAARLSAITLRIPEKRWTTVEQARQRLASRPQNVKSQPSVSAVILNHWFRRRPAFVQHVLVGLGCFTGGSIWHRGRPRRRGDQRRRGERACCRPEPHQPNGLLPSRPLPPLSEWPYVSNKHGAQDRSLNDLVNQRSLDISLLSSTLCLCVLHPVFWIHSVSH